MKYTVCSAAATLSKGAPPDIVYSVCVPVATVLFGAPPDTVYSVCVAAATIPAVPPRAAKVVAYPGRMNPILGNGKKAHLYCRQICEGPIVCR